MTQNSLFDEPEDIPEPDHDKRTEKQKRKHYAAILRAFRFAAIAETNVSSRRLDEITTYWRKDLKVLESRGHRFYVNTLTSGSLLTLLVK